MRFVVLDVWSSLDIHFYVDHCCFADPYATRRESLFFFLPYRIAYQLPLRRRRVCVLAWIATDREKDWLYCAHNAMSEMCTIRNSTNTNASCARQSNDECKNAHATGDSNTINLRISIICFEPILCRCSRMMTTTTVMMRILNFPGKFMTSIHIVCTLYLIRLPLSLCVCVFFWHRFEAVMTIWN